MKYRILGRTGRRVSVIGLGTWQLGGEWGHDYSQSEADAILDRAAACGINLVDTAECYGDRVSEKLIGDYLARRDRSAWFIATKFGHRFAGFVKRDNRFGSDDVREQLEGSLRALRTDHVDLYQFHSGTDDEFRNDALWSMLAEQKRLGKILHLGVSILGKGSENQARESAARGVEVLQVIYNRLDRRPETQVFPHAREHRLGLLARVPLASGLLSGKYASGTVFAPTDVRSTFDGADRERKLAEIEDVRREIPPGIPMSDWALAWCLRTPLVSAVIPGCRTPDQVESNARAASQVQ